MPDIAPEEVLPLLETTPEAWALDVRTPREYLGLGHLPGATLLPAQDLAVFADSLADCDGPVVVHCEHGMRSTYAVELLKELAVEPVYHLRGGMSRWHGPRAFGLDEFGSQRGLPNLLPHPWLLACAGLLRSRDAILPAAGLGANALHLQEQGMHVRTCRATSEASPVLLQRLHAWRRADRTSVYPDVNDLVASVADTPINNEGNAADVIIVPPSAGNGHPTARWEAFLDSLPWQNLLASLGSTGTLLLAAPQAFTHDLCARFDLHPLREQPLYDGKWLGLAAKR